MAIRTAYAGYPDAFIYGDDGKKKRQHLLWGDWVSVLEECVEHGQKWCYVHARGVDGWMRAEHLQTERLLEIVFVDIGQGDGCLIVTPQDRHMVIDAGEGDNMYRFLRWRYAGFKKRWKFEAAVLSHPDSDHYRGFEPLFQEPNVSFGTVYHNGIVEQTGKRSGSLGPRSPKRGRPTYLTRVIQTKQELRSFLSVASRWKKKTYPTMLASALASGRVDDVRMLSTTDGFMPGYADRRINGKTFTLQVLGPVIEPDANGKARLRWFGGVGKTKNGHSVVLRLRYGKVSMLVGGDLNIPSEDLLLSHHTGLSARPRTADEERRLVEAAKATFRADIAKACHHGSADFTETYLKAVDPIATIVSSGDDEPHAHPRADALGAFGRAGRGVRPLIFSTELARSAKEIIKHPNALRQTVKDLRKTIAKPKTEADKRKAEKKLKKILDKVLNRSIAVYGAINVRTDGDRVVLAQRLERPRSGAKWDTYRLERDGSGPLYYVSKH
ncbi:MAG: MBL fold metallo-hydrolase [Phycisphaerales bacterium]|nr:MAG: MBL fold metallo-hydrolase [Phycisphaerales bacterium]